MDTFAPGVNTTDTEDNRLTIILTGAAINNIKEKQKLIGFPDTLNDIRVDIIWSLYHEYPRPCIEGGGARPGGLKVFT